MAIELDAGASGTDTQAKALMLKANMEHIVALSTLSFVFDCVNPELARSYRARAAEAAEAACTLGEEIDPALPPGRLAPWYY